MVLSDTFRQSSHAHPKAEQADLENIGCGIATRCGGWRRKPYGTPSLPVCRLSEPNAVRSEHAAVSGRGEAVPASVSGTAGRRRTPQYLSEGYANGGPALPRNIRLSAAAADARQSRCDECSVAVARAAQRSFRSRSGAGMGGTARRTDDAWWTRRLSRMFESALGRPASSRRAVGMRRTDGIAGRRTVRRDVWHPSSVVVWKDVAHTFFNMKEFLYLR